MARFGRRQPHAPIILRAGGQPSVARIVSPRGALESQQNAIFAHRPLFRVLIKTVGPPGPIGQVVRVRGEQAAREAALRRFHPQIKSFVGKPPPQAPTAPPIGQLLIVGQKQSQAAALFAHRPLFRVLVKTVGPQPGIGRIVFALGRFAAQAAVQQRAHPKLTPYITKPIVNPFVPPPSLFPIQRSLLVLRVAYHRAARRDKIFRPTINGRQIFQRIPKRRTLLSRLVGFESAQDLRRLGRFSEILSSLINSLVAQGFLQQTGPESWTLVSGAIRQPRAPTVADDAIAGYAPGNAWINTLTNQLYFLVDATPNFAVWRGPF